MRIEITSTTEYIADDGSSFRTQEACEKHEKETREFDELVRSKLGEYKSEELYIGKGLMKVCYLPCQAAWLSPFGACFINITDLRRNEDGIVEFQLADEAKVPYDEGTVWCKANDFFGEFPK
jgi:hypothetical protein